MELTKTRCFKESKIIASKMNAKAGHLNLHNFKNWVVYLGEKENLSTDKVQHIFDYFIYECGYSVSTY